MFARRGGFDLVLGNPPWIKVEWKEAGVLGEKNPLFAIRKFSASDLGKLRDEAFLTYPGLHDSWTGELELAEATQNFLNGTQNYPLLKGTQTNLYKCFLPLGWQLSGKHGMAAYLHPEGPYDDAKGGVLREALYPRLRAHFQFQNQFMLFPIGHRNTYSINIYGSPREKSSFDQLANPFNKTPRRVSAEKSHYDPIDLEAIPDNYLPRTNYRPMSDSTEYLRRVPIVSWVKPESKPAKRVTESFRLAFRAMLPVANERTLAGA